ncbi:MAG: hypothetical protein ACLQME_11035 [Alphaproteobacteria bacterium]
MLLDRLKHAWRLFIAAPAEPFTAKNFKATLSRLSQTDPPTREMLAGFGITPEMFKQPDFDPRRHIMNLNLITALKNAMVSEEGKALLVKAGQLAPDSEELRQLHSILMKRFGSAQIEKFFRSMPPE